MTNESFIKGKLDKTLYDILFTPCYNLSVLLGDVDGKLSKNTVEKVCKGLTIISPGIIMTGNIKSPNEVKSDGIPSLVYMNEVSSHAFSIYEKLMSPPNDIVLQTHIPVSSPILLMVDTIYEHIGDIINACYLESYSIYLSTLSATREYGIMQINYTDVSRVLNNLRWVSDYLESLPEKSYILIEIIRDLYRTVAYIRSLDFLFKQTLENKLLETYREVF